MRPRLGGLPVRFTLMKQAVENEEEDSSAAVCDPAERTLKRAWQRQTCGQLPCLSGDQGRLRRDLSLCL